MFISSKKYISLILIVSILSISLGAVLVPTKKAQAVCPVGVVADEDGPFNGAWKVMDKVFQGQNIGELIVQTGYMLWDKAQKLAEWALGQALNMLLHQILTEITNMIIEWIQTGETGGPQFLSEGFGEFLKNAADNAFGTFLDQHLGLGWLCDEFDMDIKLALEQQKLPTFKNEAECKVSDMDTFFNSFTSGGGWDKWISVTDSGQNAYGAFLMAQDEARVREAKAEERAEQELARGNGFLDVKECQWYSETTGADIGGSFYVRGYPQQSSMPSSCKVTEQGPCDYHCTIKTPATTVKDVANKATTNFFDQINNMIGAAAEKAGPFSIYVEAIMHALVGKVVSTGVGLLGASPGGDPEDEPENPEFPNIGEITDVTLAKAEAQRIGNALETLEDELQNNLLVEQNNNLGVLEDIKQTYESPLNSLNDTINSCQGKNQGYVDWANGEIDNINNNLVPPVQGEIDDLNDEITDVEALLGMATSANVPTSVPEAITSIDDLIQKATTAEEVYEAVGGDTSDSQFVQALEDFNIAYQTAVSDVQDVVTSIEGSSLATDLVGLRGEVVQSISTVSSTALNLIQERGTPDWPQAGTLYYELIEEAKPYAQSTIGTAQAYKTTCDQMTFTLRLYNFSIKST